MFKRGETSVRGVLRGYSFGEIIFVSIEFCIDPRRKTSDSG